MSKTEVLRRLRAESIPEASELLVVVRDANGAMLACPGIATTRKAAAGLIAAIRREPAEYPSVAALLK